MSTELAKRADQTADAVFIQSTTEVVSFAKMEDRVAKRARRLGDRLGQAMVVRPRSEIESVVELLAIDRAGASAIVVAPDARDDLPGSWENNPGEAHTVLFTSGATGSPKGVRLSAGNWAAAAHASLVNFGFGPGKTWLCPLPLHHVGGLAIIHRSLGTGGSVFLTAHFEPPQLDQADLASLVATQLQRLLNSGSGPGFRMGSVLIGGGPVSPSLLKRARSGGLAVVPTYGMTETTAVVAAAHPGAPDPRMYPVTGIEIVTGPGNRLMVRGAQVSPGYVGEEDRQPGEWFVTADRGVVHEDGSVEALGRVDRAIISGGENIDPVAVEAVIERCPGVSAVAVVGVADEEWGQRVVAVYEGEAGEGELAAWSREGLAPASMPKQFMRVDRLPRTVLGKVDLGAVLTLVAR